LPSQATPPLCPYTTLYRSIKKQRPAPGGARQIIVENARSAAPDCFRFLSGSKRKGKPRRDIVAIVRYRLPAVPQSECQIKSVAKDRKSTRLNSSHLGISYA